MLVGINNAFQVVDIIKRNAGQLRNFGVNVARYGNINQNQRPASTFGGYLAHVLFADNVMRRAGAGNDDVRSFGLLKIFIVGNGRAIKLVGKLFGVVKIAVAYKNRFGAFVN